MAKTAKKAKDGDDVYYLLSDKLFAKYDHEMTMKIMDARLAIFSLLFREAAEDVAVLDIADTARDVTDALFGWGLATDNNEEEISQ